MHLIRLEQHAAFRDWQDRARALCAAEVHPAQVQFVPPDRDAPYLDFGAPELPKAKQAVKATRTFIEMAERVVCHSDPTRYDRLYQILWRLQSEPALLQLGMDDDVRWLTEADQAIRRDRHKMHAFVRFRKVGETDDGREQFMAWFEPSHFIVDLASGFFTRRFPNMDWAIVTPYRTAIWDGRALRFEVGGERSDVPDHDVIEEQWKTYFASIFNPARLKVGAMKAEMPVKYWSNLPEADLIPDLIRQAEHRKTRLMDSLSPAPNPIAEKAIYEPATIATNTEPPDIEALWQQVEACRRCDLWECATQGIAGVGPETARLMIVGEQPGDQEDLAGQPFVGPAGQLLDRALIEAGLSRSQAYITNAVKHFKYEVRGQRRIHRNPSIAEIRACNIWLERELELIQPDIVLCLGASAARAIAGKPVRIGPQRGRVLHRPDGRAYMVTTHPAYILRTQRFEDRAQAYPALVSDLRKVADILAVRPNMTI